jgi:hypothetical protein
VKLAASAHAKDALRATGRHEENVMSGWIQLAALVAAPAAARDDNQGRVQDSGMFAGMLRGTY